RIPVRFSPVHDKHDPRPSQGESGSDRSRAKAANVSAHRIPAAGRLDDRFDMEDVLSDPNASVVFLLGNPCEGRDVLLAGGFHPRWLIIGVNERQRQTDEVEWKGKRETNPVEEHEAEAHAANSADHGRHGCQSYRWWCKPRKGRILSRTPGRFECRLSPSK